MISLLKSRVGLVRRSSKSEDGFTLIEVMIALTLFCFIALGTAREITLIRNTKDAIFDESDLYNGLRASMNIMRSDLQQAFHIQFDDLGEDAQAAIAQAQPVARTLFDGRKKEIIFTSLSHRVYFQGKLECEQTEISFFLKQKGRFSTLMKRESERIDNELYDGGSVNTLLDNVSALEFQYWDDKDGKWIDDWNSDSGNTKDRFPFAVKIKMTTVDGKGKTLKLESAFKIAFPNNENFVTTF